MRFARPIGLLSVMALSLSLGACAQLPAAVELASVMTGGNAVAPAEQPSGKPSAREVQDGLTYWAQRFAANPGDREVALAYAANLKYVKQTDKALAVLSRARMVNGNDRALASAYGRLALETGQLDEARQALAVAFDPRNPDWRVLSAQGAILAQSGDHQGAIRTLSQAAELEPGNPSILNNLALAHALTGDAEQARLILASARAAGADNEKVAQNLKLVSALAGEARQQATAPAVLTPPSAAAADDASIVGATIDAGSWDETEWGPDLVSPAQ